MLDKLRAALQAVVLYLQENPGTATIVGGWAVLILARLGLHVSEQQLYGIVVLLLPLIAGHHLHARRARAKRAGAANARQDVAYEQWRQAMDEHSKRLNGD